MSELDDIFSLVTINEAKKVRVQIILETENGDEISIRETVRSLGIWVKKQLKKPNTTCTRQTYPLMGQGLVSSLEELLGPKLTMFLVTDEPTKYALIHSMTVGYYLLKFLEAKKIKVKTVEHPMTDEEIAEYKRVTAREGMLTRAIRENRNPADTIRSMVKEGLLTQEELQELGAEDLAKEKDQAN